ncbi:MAG: Tlg2-vesicle protein [Pycnora praestabilis]|nr:MAG: Tlg2-vesicle protein [Pycnora praestabilis]
MPADYSSTARALALPVSPPTSPSGNRQQNRSAWGPSRSGSSQRQTQSHLSRRASDMKEKVLHNADRIQRQVFKTVRKLTPLQRALAGLAIFVSLVLAILFFVFNERIFAWLAPAAEKCWFIVASANIVGSFCAFLLSRTVLSKFVNRLVAEDKRFAALSLTLKHDGLKLLCMIRLCPLPYSISNGALATFPTVSPWMFALATTIASPKLLIHVFIGSRLAAIARSGEKMDASTKAINYASIIGGIILGIATGLIIYRQTTARAEQLAEEERTKLRNSPHEERIGSFSDDPDEQTAADTVAREDGSSNLENGVEGDGYRDDFTDDEDDVFRGGDGDEETSIGLHDQHAKR